MRTLPAGDTIWTSIAVAASALGLLLLANGNAIGFFPIVAAIVCLGLSARAANSRLAVDSTITRFRPWIAAALLVLIAAVMAATLLLK